MPSSPFVGGWTIDHWSFDSEVVAEGIPTDGFKVEGPLDIAPEPAESSDTFRLDWLNENGDPCSVSGLQLAPELPEPTIAGEGLLVSFGTKDVSCDLTLAVHETIDSKHLTCIIGKMGSLSRGKGAPDTGSGTVTAIANG